jgi:hypothetical protein
MKFGGWLLYYYLMVYAGFFVMAVTTVNFFENFDPSAWDYSALYTLYLISTIPVDVLLIAETIIATFFIFKRYRSQKMVNYLRLVLIGEFIVLGMSAFIEYSHFPDSMLLTVMACIVSFIWYQYFSSSYRVYWILSNPNIQWNYEMFQNSKPRGKQYNKV